MDLSLVVFCAVYVGMMLGGLPGLRIDRTGIALLGAIVLLLGNEVTTTAAWQSIDVGTIALLFGMMVVSAQLRLAGCYGGIARWLLARPTTPARLLLELMLVVGVLSALLTNDVVCLALAPVLIEVTTRRGLDPVPFLLGLAAAANIGSAATLIGNPQNMLIGQALQLPFVPYLLDGGVPALLGLVVAWWLLVRRYRQAWPRQGVVLTADDAPFDGWQTAKGLLVLAMLAIGFLFAALPREVLAMAAAGLLLLSRRVATRELLARIDWQLLVLFAGLFVVNHAFGAAGHAAHGFTWLRDHGVDVTEPGVLFATCVVGSNLVSNVPLTMLVLPAADDVQAGAILALATTLAGNLLLVGSIANLIVVEQANRLSVQPRTRSWVAEHLRTGLPITVATLAIAAVWLWLRR